MSHLDRTCALCARPQHEHVTGNAGANAYCLPLTSIHTDWPRTGQTFQERPGDAWCDEHDDFAVNCALDHKYDDEVDLDNRDGAWDRPAGVSRR